MPSAAEGQGRKRGSFRRSLSKWDMEKAGGGANDGEVDFADLDLLVLARYKLFPPPIASWLHVLHNFGPKEDLEAGKAQLEEPTVQAFKGLIFSVEERIPEPEPIKRTGGIHAVPRRMAATCSTPVGRFLEKCDRERGAVPLPARPVEVPKEASAPRPQSKEPGAPQILPPAAWPAAPMRFEDPEEVRSITSLIWDLALGKICDAISFAANLPPGQLEKKDRSFLQLLCQQIGLIRWVLLRKGAPPVLRELCETKKRILPSLLLVCKRIPYNPPDAGSSDKESGLFFVQPLRTVLTLICGIPVPSLFRPPSPPPIGARGADPKAASPGSPTANQNAPSSGNNHHHPGSHRLALVPGQLAGLDANLAAREAIDAHLRRCGEAIGANCFGIFAERLPVWIGHCLGDPPGIHPSPRSQIRNGLFGASGSVLSIRALGEDSDKRMDLARAMEILDAVFDVFRTLLVLPQGPGSAAEAHLIPILFDLVRMRLLRFPVLWPKLLNGLIRLLDLMPSPKYIQIGLELAKDLRKVKTSGGPNVLPSLWFLRVEELRARVRPSAENDRALPPAPGSPNRAAQSPGEGQQRYFGAGTAPPKWQRPNTAPVF